MRKRLDRISKTILLCASVLCVCCGCGKNGIPSESAVTVSLTEALETETLAEETNSTEIPADKNENEPEYKGEAYFHIRNRDGYFFSDDPDTVNETADYTDGLLQREPALVRHVDDYDKCMYMMSFTLDKDAEPVFTRTEILMNDYGWYIVRKDSGTFYDLDGEFEKLFNKAVQNSFSSNPPDRLYDCSIKCDEPKTAEEYINAANSCAAVWLDSLKNESEEYRLEEYSFEDAYYKTKLLAAGYVNGVKEFAAEVHFEVSGIGKNSVFKRLYGAHNDYCDLYYGPVVYLRCKWEDGVCSVVDYKRNDCRPNDIFTSGLRGIPKDKKYPTFYDFMNDTDTVEKYLSSDTEYGNKKTGITASRNVYMNGNGDIFFCEIYTSEKPEGGGGPPEGGYAFGWKDRFFMEDGTGIYNSPVSYNEKLMKPNSFPLETGFKLNMDDYNYDGNPDWTMKYLEDENGSYYHIECTANDGTPRGYGTTGVYVAGCFDPSPLLQRTERGFIRYDIDENGKFVPILSSVRGASDEPAELEKFRMYSQKYYIKDEKRFYTDNENEMICYFWNNSDSTARAGGQYRIEKLENGEWVTVTEERETDVVSVSPRCHGELKFDISGIDRSSHSEYRIVTYAEGEPVYGGFYAGKQDVPKMSITPEAEVLPADRTNIAFTVKNTGTDPFRIASAELLRDGKTVCGIDVRGIDVLDTEREIKLTACAEIGKFFEAGNYVISVKCGGMEYSANVTLETVSEEEKYCFEAVSVTSNENGISVKLKSNLSEEMKRYYTFDSIEVFRDGVWYRTAYAEKSVLDAEYREWNNVVRCGAEELIYLRASDYYETDEYMREQFREHYEYRLEHYYEYGYETPDEVGSFEEYYKENYERMINVDSETFPEEGELCRIKVTLDFDEYEYLYFDFPKNEMKNEK